MRPESYVNETMLGPAIHKITWLTARKCRITRTFEPNQFKGTFTTDIMKMIMKILMLTLLLDGEIDLQACPHVGRRDRSGCLSSWRIKGRYPHSYDMTGSHDYSMMGNDISSPYDEEFPPALVIFTMKRKAAIWYRSRITWSNVHTQRTKVTTSKCTWGDRYH